MAEFVCSRWMIDLDVILDIIKQIKIIYSRLNNLTERIEMLESVLLEKEKEN